MKKIMNCAVLIAVLLLVLLPLLAITYGSLDGNRHPNVGTMGVTIDGQLYKFCSGTLISPTVFLTAGHCANRIENMMGITRVEVTFDPTFSASARFYPGTIHTAPGFTGIRGPDPVDLGVVVFDEPIVGITPAAIAPVGLLDRMFREGTLKNHKFTAVGYGDTAQFQYGPPVRELNSDRRYAVSEFLALTEGWLHVSQNPATGDAGTCFGDSGGPSFLGAGENETPYIVATTSKGDAMCRASDIRYRVDTQSAHDFLSQYVTLP